MRNSICFLLLVLSCAVARAQHDVRVVNGIPVDLAPIHKWFSTKPHTGERPMKHWQLVKITNCRKSIGSWELCQVRLEDGSEAEVFVEHLPTKIATAFCKLNKAKQELEALREEIQIEESNLALITPPASRKAAADAIWLRHQIEAKRARLKLLEKQVGDTTVSWTEREGELSTSGENGRTTGSLAAEAMLAARAPLLAMDSGRRYANYPIWDTGLAASSSTSAF